MASGCQISDKLPDRRIFSDSSWRFALLRRCRLPLFGPFRRAADYLLPAKFVLCVDSIKMDKIRRLRNLRRNQSAANPAEINGNDNLIRLKDCS